MGTISLGVTMVEWLGKDKQSGLLGPFISNEKIKDSEYGPWSESQSHILTRGVIVFFYDETH